MKYLITESQQSNLSKLIIRSFEKYGFNETIKRFNFTMPIMIEILGDAELPKFSCGNLNEICSYLMYEGIVKRKYVIGQYHIKLDRDDLVGSVYFKFTDEKEKYSLDGYAAPYWDNRCHLPIEIEYYSEWEDGDREVADIDLTGERYYKAVKVPVSFKKFQDIIDWMENGYIRSIIDFCKKTKKELNF
jgi:hypothetical protein